MDDTDIDEACGELALPCVARVGECLNGRMAEDVEGHITPGGTACQCFARGMMEATPLDEASPDFKVIRTGPVNPDFKVVWTGPVLSAVPPKP
jgi:hypothetical protein